MTRRAAITTLSVSPATVKRWSEGALRLLSRGGYGALNIRAVCSEVGASTGAFYHSFGSWRAFTCAVLQEWGEEQVAVCDAAIRSSDDPVARLDHLIRALSEQCARTAGAVRIWSNVDGDAAGVQHAVDGARNAIVLEAMQTMLGPADAKAYAVWGQSLLAGFGLRRGSDGPSLKADLALLVASALHRRS